jgi:hypothetical protein
MVTDTPVTWTGSGTPADNPYFELFDPGTNTWTGALRTQTGTATTFLIANQVGTIGCTRFAIVGDVFYMTADPDWPALFAIAIT